MHGQVIVYNSHITVLPLDVIGKILGDIYHRVKKLATNFAFVTVNKRRAWVIFDAFPALVRRNELIKKYFAQDENNCLI